MTPDEESQLAHYATTERTSAAWLAAVLAILSAVCVLWATERWEILAVLGLVAFCAGVPVAGFFLWAWHDLRKQRRRAARGS